MSKDWSGVIGAILRLIVGIAGLVALMLIIGQLPMMRDLPRIVGDALSSLIMTFIILVIVWFGWRMKSELPLLLPRFPDAGSIIFALAALAAVIVGYFAYGGAQSWLIERNLPWLYPLVFLLLALGALAALVILAFTNIDKLTQLGQQMATSRQVQQQTPERTPVRPIQEASPPSASTVAPPQSGPTAPAQNRCPRCGTVANPGDVFCGSCGTRLQST